MAVRIESHAEPIPGYRLIERIGGGGFGEVWKAEAPGGLHKAIKFVFGDLGNADDGSQRAEQELKALSRVTTVRHPYILSLERFDIIDGQLIIVMELAERNLWDRFKECRTQGLIGIPREELLIYMEETAEALDLMNTTYQLQHLDIKPQNLFLMFQHVKVADFGLVKDLEGMQASVTGGVTPVYAAPETFDGWVSRFCDQYSLAIVYQELLTGQRPFSGNNVRQLILQHLQAAPNLSSLPPDDQRVIARALAKVPDQRYPTCRDMVRLLRQNSSGLAGTQAVVVPGATPLPVLSPARTSVAELDSNEITSPPTANMRGPQVPDSKQGLAMPVPQVEPPTDSEPLDTPSRKAPSEVRGEGVLFPALVIGIGQLGMQVLQRLRDRIVQRFDSPSQLPNVRLLLIDTDSEIVKAATRCSPSSALSVHDIVLTPLHRPSHYLRPREGRLKIETWIDPRMLYRIPRSQVTGGVRALGRLAFVDHSRNIVNRLQKELDGCLNPNVLALAGRQTKLGIRSNRPRVYVVAGLAGGTGSGMLLDLTYTVRQLLKRIGYEQPDIVGLCLLPPAEGTRARASSLGNAYAALSEINFFSMPGNSFAAQYHERDVPLLDTDPPFSRCFLLPLADEANTPNSRETLDLAGQFLFRDLASPLGQATELARAALPLWQRGQAFSTFGLYQVSWPRRELLRTAARRLCHRLVLRWMSRDAKGVSRATQIWISEEWKKKELGADQFIAGLRDKCEKELMQAPEDAFQEIIAPLIRRYTELAKTVAGKKGNVPIPDITATEVENAMTKFEELLGKPQDDYTSDEPKRLVKAVRAAGAALTAKWEQKLMELPVRLIEQSEFRLAGAEEAVRHVVGAIEQILRHHEPLAKDLGKRASDAYARLQSMSRPQRPGGRCLVLPPEDTLELLRSYPKWRFQSLMLQCVAAAFVAMRGNLSDELREINFLRVRLTELARMLEAVPEREGADGPAQMRCLYPAGCISQQEATEQFLSAFTSDLLLELDAKIQEVIRRDYTSLIHVCMTSKNMLKDVESAMIQTAVAFGDAMLSETSVSEILYERYPDTAELGSEVAELYAKAGPKLSARSTEAGELFVLATPPGAPSEAFTLLANRILPEAQPHRATSHDDIIFYREKVNLSLAEVEQMGPAAQEAYRQMMAMEHFTPHIRTDIDFEALAPATVPKDS
jgi:eukaryotic-like serine/threonine-protein kinase